MVFIRCLAQSGLVLLPLVILERWVHESIISRVLALLRRWTEYLLL